MWIGTEDGGVSRYKDGVFTGYTNENGLPENAIWGLAFDDQGSLLVVTQSAVVRWDNGSFVSYAYRRTNINSRSGIFYYKVDNRIRLLDEPGSPVGLIKGNLAQQAITSIYVDRTARIWVGAKSGLSSIDSGKVTTYSAGNGMARSAVVTYCEDREGALWMGTQNGGMLMFKDGRFQRFTTNDGLSSDSITSIFQDREGTLWIGTNDHGLNRLKRQIITAYSEQDGLIGKNAYPIYQDPSGEIWIGCGGLQRYSDGKFYRYAHTDPDDTSSDQVPFAVVTSLFQDRDAVLWIGQVGGLYTFKDGRFTRHQILPYSPFIWSIYQTGDGAMWFGM
ncbi:MAG: ligand-binding sensor domain-containing protein, partial [Blastocatellia bacterium]